jgi:hypothetical protein
MPSRKPKRGPCLHDHADFVTVDFKHSRIFGHDGYTERARCHCGYTIRGAAHDAEPTGAGRAAIVERMCRVIAQHGANHQRRDAICTDSVFTDQLRRLNPPVRTARKLPE